MIRTIYSSLLGLAAFALLVPAGTAEAQCDGGAWFCAEVHVGGSVEVSPPPRRQQQVVVVHEEEPPPPPVVVYQPPPERRRTVVVRQRQQRHYHYDVEPVQVGMGLHGQIGGMISDRVHMGGAHGAFRLRPGNGHFALDLGVGAYAGQDFNGMDRVEVPLTADFLFFVNPRHRLQVYGVAGVGLSVGHAEGFNESIGNFDERDYAHVGGQLGAGLELRLSRWFALNGDVRGFVRERVDDDPRPEFVDEDGRTTDTSGGVLLNLGATVYF